MVCKTCDGVRFVSPEDGYCGPCPDCNQEAIKRSREHYAREAKNGPAFLDLPGPMFTLDFKPRRFVGAFDILLQ